MIVRPGRLHTGGHDRPGCCPGPPLCSAYIQQPQRPPPTEAKQRRRGSTDVCTDLWARLLLIQRGPPITGEDVRFVTRSSSRLWQTRPPVSIEQNPAWRSGSEQVRIMAHSFAPPSTAEWVSRQRGTSSGTAQDSWVAIARHDRVLMPRAAGRGWRGGVREPGNAAAGSLTRGGRCGGPVRLAIPAWLCPGGCRSTTVAGG